GGTLSATNYNFAFATGTLTVTGADVGVTKSGPATITAGNNIAYNITVANSAPTFAQNLTLTDALPARTTFISLAASAGSSCSSPAIGGTGTVSCTIATLASGASAVFTLVFQAGVSIAGGTIISNTASVSSTTADPVPGNNSASASTTVSAGNVDVAITK